MLGTHIVCNVYSAYIYFTFFRYYLLDRFSFSIRPAGFNQNCNANCEFKHNNICNAPKNLSLRAAAARACQPYKLPYYIYIKYIVYIRRYTQCVAIRSNELIYIQKVGVSNLTVNYKYNFISA